MKVCVQYGSKRLEEISTSTRVQCCGKVEGRAASWLGYKSPSSYYCSARMFLRRSTSLYVAVAFVGRRRVIFA